MENTNEEQLGIELSEEVAEGTFSNLAFITHSASEFVLDFIRIMPGVPKAKVKSRIIMTPEHAKRFMLALQENVRNFENEHGALRASDEKNYNIGGFGGPTAQA